MSAYPERPVKQTRDGDKRHTKGARWLMVSLVFTACLAALAATDPGGADVPEPLMSAPDVLRIPIKKAHSPSDPPDAARFSHWAHGDFQCYNCHMSIFPMNLVGFVHEDMRQGRFCGSCHDGQRVWGPDDPGVDCETCHVPATEQEEIDEDDLFD